MRFNNKVPFNNSLRMMKKLSETWFAEPVFDYEYKTYEVMAYAKSMEDRFSQRKFFPYLDDVKRTLHNLDAYRTAKAQMTDGLKTDLLELDLRRLQMIRAALPDNSGIMATLDEIVNFAAQMLGGLYKEGTEILDQLSREVEITPLGIHGGALNPGFLFFRKPRSVRIYTYYFRLVRRPWSKESYKDVCTRYHSEIAAGPFDNLNAVKWDLMGREKGLGSKAPNAYLVHTDIQLPQYETLLPIAKRYLIKTAA